tara:strand:+ start:203 stop:400 length:198 start_codon:yes stop_codon:yes gene_type:complete
MGSLILLDEYRLNKSINDAEDALKKARYMVSIGTDVPLNIIPRLESLIEELENRLLKLIEGKDDN